MVDGILRKPLVLWHPSGRSAFSFALDFAIPEYVTIDWWRRPNISKRTYAVAGCPMRTVIRDEVDVCLVKRSDGIVMCLKKVINIILFV